MTPTQTWNQCVLAYSNGEFVKRLRLLPEQKGKITKLAKAYGKNYNIWYDTLGGKAFSISQNTLQQAHKTERSFLCPPQNFLTGPMGKEYCDDMLGELLGGDRTSSSEYIIQNSAPFAKVKGKTVMIVGAGPSALKIDWSRYKYDQLWSCNHFFKSKKLASKKVDLWIPTDEVDLVNDKSLHRYLEKNPDSWCCLYPTDKRSDDYIKAAQKYVPNMTYAHLRYRAKIGIAPWLVLLAMFSGAKNIMFVGMDGLPTNKTPHAFELNKPLSGRLKSAGAVHVFRRQYAQLWDYILFYMKSKANFFNLGEGEPTNLTANVSKINFPLRRLHSRMNEHLVRKSKANRAMPRHRSRISPVRFEGKKAVASIAKRR